MFGRQCKMDSQRLWTNALSARFCIFVLGFVKFGGSATTGYLIEVLFQNYWSVWLGFGFGFVFFELEAVNVWQSKQDGFTPLAMIRNSFSAIAMPISKVISLFKSAWLTCDSVTDWLVTLWVSQVVWSAEFGAESADPPDLTIPAKSGAQLLWVFSWIMPSYSKLFAELFWAVPALVLSFPSHS